MIEEFDKLLEKIQKIDEREWLATLNLSKAFEKEYTDETIRGAGEIASKAIEAFIERYRDNPNQLLASAAEKLEDEFMVDQFKEVDTVEEFDAILDELYDIGDGYSIWIKTKF